ncbi:MAG: ribonuclease III [Eubacterium sp.]|nr:ribonuclease III [Eubacterium sp.]
MEALESKINYKFKNRSYLIEALTHSSYANEYSRNLKSNERLEFLGDTVLSLISGQYLFENYPDMPEGELTKLKASLVCTNSLMGFAKQINLGDYLFLGKGEKMTGGAKRPSILEDAFESLIAAIYLDGGLETARSFVLSFLKPALENHRTSFKDYKTILQEVIQQNPDQSVNYVFVGESGPDHNKVFEAEVRLNSNAIGRGKGKSKKSAEQAAAKEALILMGLCDEEI